ncbi:YbcC family protein [Neorhodopirellula lusitana]|uniref:YbcC family protein n=1 Tax=Neorhodopirellula lusitana TaxID=445327 RepID=UPI00384AFE3A
MKTIESPQSENQVHGKPLSVFMPAPYDEPHVHRQFEELLEQVTEVVAPVWPLKDLIAVNPYAGLTERPFFESRDYLRTFSRCELLPSLSHFAKEYADAGFTRQHVESAMEELDISSVGLLSVAEVMQALKTCVDSGCDERAESAVESHLPRVTTVAAQLSAVGEMDWCDVVRDEIGKHCASYYQEGQSAWENPWKDQPLYQAWRSAALIDRGAEFHGLEGFRHFVSKLPHTVDATIHELLQRLDLPESLWESYLLAHAFAIPGWSGWTKFQDMQDETAESRDFRGLLAISLVYDAAISEFQNFHINWSSLLHHQIVSMESLNDDAKAVRRVLLRATEIAFREQLLEGLSIGVEKTADAKSREPSSDFSASLADSPTLLTTKLAQLAFCIDVRSERVRRHIESESDQVETFGFAGFFGLPFEYVPLGQESGNVHAPVLLKPKFKLEEKLSGCVDENGHAQCEAIEQRRSVRTWRKLWKGFQSSAVGCFSFVETMGLFDGLELAARLQGGSLKTATPETDGVGEHGVQLSMNRLREQNVSTDQQADFAAGLLTGMGLTENFASLVGFCGHGSQTDNNPLAAGLDCGACGGHSGAPNARLAALLLNDRSVRERLVQRGITIPAETHFMAGWHNTTTDQIEWFDLDAVPASHQSQVVQLQSVTDAASESTRLERQPTVGETSTQAIVKRASDWSQTRPEWGLAGNAGMIIGPRSMTQNANLDGRVFLHSYNCDSDPEAGVLEAIMTAPMVVAHWINMQYYASSVDSRHFGSGNKTIHNVVGRFGVLSGNGGDLQSGLPDQSLRNGEHVQHAPLRLQTIIVASRQAIDSVIEKHGDVRDRLQNGWMHLIAIDGGQQYRYQEDGDWVQLSSGSSESIELFQPQDQECGSLV